MLQKLIPKKSERIKFNNAESGKTLIFLTNNFHLKATEIAQLYKHRWEIERFFKWIKQHLKIKSFFNISKIYLTITSRITFCPRASFTR
ncbi:transposase [Niabella aurantiaca]|uniref:transposase n=1 Tax=Niabella aurantiaca TaxID=379900 RepID=UPI0008FC118A